MRVDHAGEAHLAADVDLTATRWEKPVGVDLEDRFAVDRNATVHDAAGRNDEPVSEREIAAGHGGCGCLGVVPKEVVHPGLPGG